jgi:uncharacterized protein with PIN domain
MHGWSRADHRLLSTLPPRIRALGSTARICPHCGRLYWEGSHVRRIRRRLNSFAREAAQPLPDDLPARG